MSIILNPIQNNQSNSLNISSVVYRITKFQNQPKIEFNLVGSGTAHARVRVCDSSLGCRDATPTTIHQSQNVIFTNNGLNTVDILEFTKSNEAKRLNILYTNNLGQTTTLDFTINSAFPKSYSIVSTTFSKIITESSHISVNSNNIATTTFNRFDFRSFYIKQNQNQIINFKDYLVGNDAGYVNLSGFIHLQHGLELSQIQKVNSVYELKFKSVPYQDKIMVVLDNYYLDINSKELTLNQNSSTIPTNNIVLSSNYNKSSVSNIIFNFRNTPEHGSNIRVTAPFTVGKNIFGLCNSAIVCINKQPIKSINYRKVISIK